MMNFPYVLAKRHQHIWSKSKAIIILRAEVYSTDNKRRLEPRMGDGPGIEPTQAKAPKRVGEAMKKRRLSASEQR
jgi:hypothetical protein